MRCCRARSAAARAGPEEPLLAVTRAELGFQLRTAKREIMARNLVLTTGGQSYPGCGTTGDGYRFAAEFGHTIVPPRPALVPITTDALWVRELRGITMPDVLVRVVEPAAADAANLQSRKVLAERRGSLLFAHFGLSGPVVLDVSRAVSGHAEPAFAAAGVRLSAEHQAAASSTSNCAPRPPTLARSNS